MNKDIFEDKNTCYASDRAIELALDAMESPQDQAEPYDHERLKASVLASSALEVREIIEPIGNIKNGFRSSEPVSVRLLVDGKSIWVFLDNELADHLRIHAKNGDILDRINIRW